MDTVVPFPPKAPELRTPWYTPERAAVQATARAFARDEIFPVANELDPQKGIIPQHLLDRIAELGYFGVTIPTEFGGMGLGVFEYCMISEELARAWTSTGSIIGRAQGLGTDVGDAERRAALLRRSAAGTWVGAGAFSEPNAGSDLGSVQTTARLKDGAWTISGDKRWIGNSLAADFIQILCRKLDSETGEDTGDMVMLLVEKERGVFPDGMTGTPIDKVGYHGFVTWQLHLDGVTTPEENVIGAGTGAFKDVQRFLNIARVQTAARAVGLARGALEDTIVYLQWREQFGQPLAEFQALRFDIAQMAAEIDQARNYYMSVATLLDSGDAAVTEAAMVKLLATEMAVGVTNTALQLHGGNGYTTEHQVERYWRDARLTTIFEGTSQIQKHTIANRLLGRVPRRGA